MSKRFIEVHCASAKVLVNLDRVEEIREGVAGICTIYYAFSVPNAIDQENITTDESYEQVKKLIEEAEK